MLFPEEDRAGPGLRRARRVDRRAGRVYEVVWATGWGAEADRLLAPLLGVPRLPVVPFPRTPFTADLKVPAIDALAGDRPAAWIDDLLGPAASHWAARARPRRRSAAGGPAGRLDPGSRRAGAGVGASARPVRADHSIAGQWSMTTSSPAAAARSAAASSITPSCSHTALRADLDRLVDVRAGLRRSGGRRRPRRPGTARRRASRSPARRAPSRPSGYRHDPLALLLQEPRHAVRGPARVGGQPHHRPGPARQHPFDRLRVTSCHASMVPAPPPLGSPA